MNKKQFKRYGKTRQLLISNSEALKHILDFDEANWVATTAPIDTINIDQRFLKYLDTDKDNRIRPGEVKKGISWLINNLNDIKDINHGNTSLNIESINQNTKQGQQIYKTAMSILDHYKQEEQSISLDQIRQLLRKDQKDEYEDRQVLEFQLVEKLILYQSNMLTFVNSFVSFPDLYDPESRALFEMGTLIIDGRHFTLSVKIPDQKRHIQFCKNSKMFVLYVKVFGNKQDDSYEVAVPVTAGTRGNLQVNKLGIFIDIDGNEFNAEIIKIIENPIGFIEALISPFTSIYKAYEDKIEQISTNAEKKLETLGTDELSSITKKDNNKVAASQSTNGLLSGGAVAFAAISSSLAFIAKIISSLTWKGFFGGVFGLLLLIFVPMTLMAIVKLSKRDLSSILEGSGWGINQRMKLTIKQARTFTRGPISKK